VDCVSSVGYSADTTVRVGYTIGTPDDIAVPTLLPGFRVSGKSVGNRVAKVILGIVIIALLVAGVSADSNRSSD
jgi:hypothetical protein